MEFRQLGRSGLLVSSLCLGTMIFGEDGQRGADEKSAIQIIHKFLDAGGNHVDTADVYAGGRSEQIVGTALKGHRDRVILATKLRHATGPDANDQGLSRHHVMAGVEASLRRLQTDVIDLLIAHAWDPLTPPEETLRSFDDLVTSGKVRYVGVSNFKAWQFMKSLALSDIHGWVRFVSAQYQYSLVERNIEHEITELCLGEGVGLTAWGPLGGGYLTGKYGPGSKPREGRLATMPDEAEESWEHRSSERNWRILQTVNQIASAHEATASQVSLAWLLHQPVVCSVIIGARTLAQLADNLGASELPLSEAELASLDEVSQPVDPYPYGFLKIYGARPSRPTS